MAHPAAGGGTAPVMAHPAPASGRAKTTTKSHRMLKCIIISILSVIALIGLAILIVWLALRPKRLVYTVESAKVSNFDLQNNQLNGTFDVILRAYNPNNKISLYYDTIEVSVTHDDQTLALDVVQPFFQPRDNITRFEVKPTSQSVVLHRSVAKDLGKDKSSGKLEVAVRVKAKIRYKLGIWKSSHYKLKVYCSPVVIHLMSSSKTFETERAHCDVDT